MGRNDKQGPEEADYKKESRGDGGGSAPGGHGTWKKKKRERVGLVRPDLSDQQHSSLAKPRPGDILNSNQSDKQVLLLQKR